MLDLSILKYFAYNFATSIKAAPVDNVASSSIGISQAPIDLSFIGLFLQADIMVKCVMLLLIIASVMSWAIIFDKLVSIKSIKSKTKNFEKSFWSGQSLEVLYERIKGRENHPIANVFSAAMHEWMNRNSREIAANSNLKIGIKERINQAMQVASNKSMEDLEKNVSFLATVGSSAPFIGLFGTVWGIMISFQAIAISKNTSLAVVAPGIAEALLATAVGLVAAIPAVIFYNKFTTDLNRLSGNLEDFSMELHSIMSKEIDNVK